MKGIIVGLGLAVLLFLGVAKPTQLFSALQQTTGGSLVASAGGLRAIQEMRGEVNYSKISPKELLDILKHKVAEHQAFNGGMASKNWITKEDVKYLMPLIDSQESCLPVVSPITSDFYIDIKSTVGKEALFLIEGYRLGRYPPIVSSVCFKPDIEGIKVWWTKQDGETFASLGLPEGVSLIGKKPNPATIHLKNGETAEVYFYRFIQHSPDNHINYGVACFERDPETKKTKKTAEKNFVDFSNPMKGYLKDVDKDGTEEIVIEGQLERGTSVVSEVYAYKYISGYLYPLLRNSEDKPKNLEEKNEDAPNAKQSYRGSDVSLTKEEKLQKKVEEFMAKRSGANLYEFVQSDKQKEFKIESPKATLTYTIDKINYGEEKTTVILTLTSFYIREIQYWEFVDEDWYLCR